VDIRAYIESGVIESYVLGMATAQEAAELEMLRMQHPELGEAIARFEQQLENAALLNAVNPPPAVREALFAKLESEFVTARPMTPVRTMTGLRFAAAAAILLLVISSALNVYFYSRFRDANEKFAALFTERNSLEANLNITHTRMLDMYGNMQLMGDPAMIKVSMTGTPGREQNLATVFWDSKTRDIYLLANKLPQAPSGKQYQLWALVDGKPVDAGMIGDCNGLCRLKNIPRAQAFAITLEREGGSPTPTMDQMYVLGKVG